MFYSTTENKYINEGVPFTLNEVQYPANWLQCASLAEKEAIGLVEVQTVGSPADDRFYWVSSVLENGTLTYTNIPKDLEMLKTYWKKNIRECAYSILLPTDYVEIRNLRDSTYKPEVVAWRDSIRDVVDMVLVTIDSATDVSVLENALQITWPTFPSDNASVEVSAAPIQQ